LISNIVDQYCVWFWALHFAPSPSFFKHYYSSQMLYAQIKLNSMQLLSSFNNLLQAPIFRNCCS